MRTRTIARRKELATRAKAYVHANLASHLTLDHVAEKLDISPSFLSRTFIDEVGTSLSSFVVAARMKKAEELLKNPLLLVKQVAKDTGYENADAFSRIYKAHFGRTPTDAGKRSG